MRIIPARQENINLRGCPNKRYLATVAAQPLQSLQNASEIQSMEFRPHFYPSTSTPTMVADSLTKAKLRTVLRQFVRPPNFFTGETCILPPIVAKCSPLPDGNLCHACQEAIFGKNRVREACRFTAAGFAHVIIGGRCPSCGLPYFVIIDTATNGSGDNVSGGSPIGMQRPALLVKSGDIG